MGETGETLLERGQKRLRRKEGWQRFRAVVAGDRSLLPKDGRQPGVSEEIGGPADHTAMVVTEFSGYSRPIVREATPDEKKVNPNSEWVQVRVPGGFPKDKVLVVPGDGFEKWYQLVNPGEAQRAEEVVKTDQQAESLLELRPMKFFKLMTPKEREGVRPEDRVAV
jgi:hypothetical protein